MNDRRAPEKMKCQRIIVVTVADLPEGGGRTSRLRTLVSTLASLGHQVEIWNEHNLSAAAPPENVSVSGELSGVPFHYVLGTTDRGCGFGATRTKFRAVRTIAAKLRREQRGVPVDLVIFNNLSFYDTFPLTRLARRLGARTIQCYEDERLELLPDPNGDISFARRLFGLNSWLADRYCSRMADAIFVISGYLQRKYERLSGPAKVHLIPTIVDCAAWRLPPEDEPNPARLFYAGTLGPQDDLDVLAKALSNLKQQGLEFRLAMAGCGPGKKSFDLFFAKCRSLGIAENVEVLGFLKHGKIKEHMGRSHLLVNLRRRSIWSDSGQSTKLSEYLATGRAVLTTDLGDNARYVENESSAFVVSPDISPDELARLLKRVLTDQQLRIQVGAAGRRAAETHFDIPIIRERLRSILTDLFNEPVSF
ncbi:MAG TPA: glycosyltransferase family 4 protein [Verrucomicrobiae bacterium]